MGVTPTHCPYCALQCGMNLVGSVDGLTVAPRPDFPTNKGGLCTKGWSSTKLIGHPDRLTTPLMRDSKEAPLRPVSWEQALDAISKRMLAIQSESGRDSVAVFGGGGLTNEKAYMLGKFARVALRTANIDYNGRFCMSSAASAGIMAFGLDRGLPFPLEDIPFAETILLVGSNIAETMPPIMQYLDAQRERGGSLIVVDPRRTPTAAAAALHLQLTPGTDAALANGLLYIAGSEGYLDLPFISARTQNFEAVQRTIASYWPDRVERITGVSVPAMKQATHLLGQAKTAMVLTSRGAEQQSRGVANVLSFVNLILALGKAGKPHCGYGCITGQGNGQGGREHGQKADQLPGYRRIDNPEHRKHIAKVWGVDEANLPGKGKSAYELFDSLGTPDGVRALFVMGSNPVVSAPNAGHVQQRLRDLDLLVVSDIFLSETAEIADVVLPCTQWAEEEGTMTNLEGRVILRRRAVDPPKGVRSDLQVLSGLARGLGCTSGFPEEPREVFDELRMATAGGIADYAGIDYDRIVEEDGVFWPCPHVDHPGTPRMFLERFETEDGRARFHAVAYKPADEVPDDEYPLFLTTGRVLSHYQSGTQTRRVAALTKVSSEPFVELHPALARAFRVGDGEELRVATRRGSILVKARLTHSIRQDTLFIPFHWSGSGCANLLTNPALDPISGMPEFKVCAARIDVH